MTRQVSNNYLKTTVLILAAALQTGCENHSESADFQPDDHPLFTAIANANQQQVAHYIKSGKPVNIQDQCNWTPLMKAALDGHSSISEQLLKAGASVNMTDSGDYTALLLAASNNHKQVIELLLAHGADINHREQTKGWSALIWSAKRGHIETVKFLLNNHADRTIRDNSGKTALDWARNKKYLAIAELLEH